MQKQEERYSHGKLLSAEYPGGKSALYPAIANIIESNNMKHCIYIEPFAGGANIAWSLLINGIVDYIIINDADKSVYSFWRAITESTHWFIEKIESVSVTVDEWRKQRAILQESSRYSKELGFAMFFLNRPIVREFWTLDLSVAMISLEHIKLIVVLIRHR